MCMWLIVHDLYIFWLFEKIGMKEVRLPSMFYYV